MTVEVGVLNKQGVALATDSAVTIGNGSKFYNTANKLFALSKYNPVGIMVYSNAEIMGYPVEILIKEYRRKLGNKHYGTVKEYWEDFLKYLIKVFEDKDNKNYYFNQIYMFLSTLDRIINNEVEKLRNSFEDSTKDIIMDNVNNIIYKIINNFYEHYKKLDDDYVFKKLEDKIREQCLDDIRDTIQSEIGILEERSEEQLIEICIMILTKKHDQGSRTGIVIAGYGEEELYPRLINGEFLGIFFGEIKYSIKYDVSINNENEAYILPFAQDDVINTFMTGIDNDIYCDIINAIDETKELMIKESDCKCNNIDKCFDKLSKDISGKIQEKSATYHWEPIFQTVSVAPKEELSHMAETLVNLTSFKRNLSMDEYSQSVGGPIDVALISKGDGFIWIKRKHYFDKNLNSNFFQNYYK